MAPTLSRRVSPLVAIRWVPVKNRGPGARPARAPVGLGLELRTRAGARAPGDVMGETGTQMAGKGTAFRQCPDFDNYIVIV